MINIFKRIKMLVVIVGVLYLISSGECFLNTPYTKNELVNISKHADFVCIGKLASPRFSKNKIIYAQWKEQPKVMRNRRDEEPAPLIFGTMSNHTVFPQWSYNCPVILFGVYLTDDNCGFITGMAEIKGMSTEEFYNKLVDNTRCIKDETLKLSEEVVTNKPQTQPLNANENDNDAENQSFDQLN